MKANQVINEQSERMRILQKLARSIVTRPYLLTALTLYWTWVNLAFQGPLFFPSVELSSGLLYPVWIGPVAAYALAYAVLGRWFRPLTSAFRQRWYVGAVAGLMMAGALVCFVWMQWFEASLQTPIHYVLYTVGSLGVGVGTACFLVEWARVFGFLGPQEVLFQGIVAMLGSALTICLLSFLPLVVGQLLFVLIPVPLALCFYRVMRDLPRKTVFEHGMNTPLRLPYKLVITAFIHGLALGVLLGSLVMEGSDPVTILVNASSFVFAALLLLLTAVFVKMDFNHLVYQVGFPLMAFGALLVACVRGVPVVGESLQLIGFCYVHLLMWGVCSYLTKTFELPAAWVVAWPTCAAMAGQILGGSASSWLAQLPGSTGSLQVAAMVVSFVLLFSALLMLSNRNLTTGWGIARPANPVNTDTTLDAVTQMLSVENSLTPRESEILGMMARGRNRRFISEELVLSEETVKSHVYGMYRKLGIHSQQELLDLVEVRASGVEEQPQKAVFE